MGGEVYYGFSSSFTGKASQFFYPIDSLIRKRNVLLKIHCQITNLFFSSGLSLPRKN